MRDTFILTGRATPESSEEETGRITEEGQTLKKAEGQQEDECKKK